MNVIRSSASCPARSARWDGRRLIPPEAARRSSCRSPSIQRARIVAITSSAWSAGCVLASPWIAHVTRCAASPPPWSRSSPPRTRTGACDWRPSTTPCSMSESVPRCWCCSPPWGWCCSSRVRTWRTCCWPGASLVSANWPCARRSGPDAHASFASSSRRVSASRSSAARAVSCWRSLPCRPCGSCCRPR